jgi:hypothetical protein
MTSPGVITTPGSVIGSVPTNPDGTPNFPAAAGGAGLPGKADIWNLPAGIDPTRKIWIDIGHSGGRSSKVTEYRPGEIKPGRAVQHTTPVSSYQIMKSPIQVLQQFAAMSQNDPQKYFALQGALANGPWGKVYASGAWDSNTEAALKNAMVQYIKLADAGVGMSFFDYLIQTSERNQALGGDGSSHKDGSGTNTAIAVSDPTEIRAAAQSAAQAALGQGLSEDQLDKFVAQFQASQKTAETATSGTVTSQDLSSDAMQFAQQSNPEEYQQNQRQTFEDTLVNMFAPSESQRPNMTPVPKA